MTPEAPSVPLPDDDGRRRVVIENLAPAVDGGRFPVTRIAGDRADASAAERSDEPELQPRESRDRRRARGTSLAYAARCGGARATSSAAANGWHGSPPDRGSSGPYAATCALASARP